MKILYAACLCSEDKYNRLFERSKFKPGQQVQKYHRLIVEGLAENNINVNTVTVLPVTRLNCPKIFIKHEREKTNNVNYVYLPLINLPIIKNIIAFIGSFLYAFFSCIKDKETVVICDVLNISVCAGTLSAAKILKRKNVGIVTDVPIFLSEDDKKLSVRINNFIISKFNSYLFLTEEMNKLINIQNRPYVVIEGQVDINMKDTLNNLDNKYVKQVCIYAGGLQKIYGIEILTKAFIKADIDNVELHLYGNGDYEEELKEICKVHSNIKYFGVMPNNHIVKEELKASLLINPRPTNEEYTKYSFPSKNMEYMVSGTPILTTKLPGMPEEYYQYIYLIEDETVDGLALALKFVLSKSKDELQEKGKVAKEFVLKEKNNVAQAERILKLVQN